MTWACFGEILQSVPGGVACADVCADVCPVSVDVPVSRLGQPSLTQWSAVLERRLPNLTGPRALSVSLSSPASASIGVYTLQLRVEAHLNVKTHSLGQITLLCNPWCQTDSVFLQSEDLRTEYVRSDIGLLFKGSPGNMVSRPWSFDQFEKGILDICMKLLQLSPQHQTDMRKDLQNRSDPVYIGRVISAMVNSNDDKGVLMGNWSGDYSGGVNPSQWSGSADILKKWAESQFRPVKYGQCWVFAAVMCTVMRALGIPTRVITNFNSAHDTDGNMVIEEYYNEMGKKLSMSKDSIWNFHVWVESWMKRPDLGQGYEGWQVLDATPQEKSAGMFRCGPAAVKAIYQQKVEAQYDVPFVYAEVNADVRTIIIKDKKVLSTSIDKKRVGALIATKRPGSMLMQDITSEYKTEKGMFRCGPAAVKAIYQQKVEAQYDVPFVYAEVNADVRTIIIKDKKVLSTSIDKKRVGALIATKRPGSMLMQDITSEYKTEKAPGRHPLRDEESGFAISRHRFHEDDSAGEREASKGIEVSLQLLKAPVVGENISFNVIITNNMAAPKLLKKHVNAQNKEYNRNPTGTFWEAHDDVKIAPNETLTIKHEIPFNAYMLKEAVEDYMVNLAVVIEDVESQERVLASEEFNIRSPTLSVQIQNEFSVVINTPQVATVTFTNLFNVAVSGELTVSGSGLLEEKAQMTITIQPQETMKRPVNFTPKMAGAKMLSASLVLTNPATVLHGFKTINVQAS
ncbi:protein-glutamine gamma-glutamyltransferase 5-like [Sinocyclocheilus grahami]|uniref:protein-glutamine gamma-glutamyltransferase 5-like n=1 Tax=Sinocyclocheilus grahami TaxID=75366 RepID=UPI0007ACA39E|nr:PREDICTED: protein-glutamine gamma-glutamyltransferase 5-like [Sinocyclocheilus grahami]